MATYGLGGMGLAGFGQGQKQQAMGMLGQAAEVETSRNMQNKQLEAQHEAGKAQFGGMLGATAGMAFGGPVGAAIGLVAGSLLGGELF